MKKDPPDNILYSVHIALLSIFPKPGLMRVSRLVWGHLVSNQNNIRNLLPAENRLYKPTKLDKVFSVLDDVCRGGATHSQ